MRPGMRAEIWRFFFIALIIGVGGWFLGYVGQALIAYLVCYIAWTFWSAVQFTRWIENGKETSLLRPKRLWADLEQVLDVDRIKAADHLKTMRESMSRISHLTHAIDGGIVVLKKDFKLDWWNSAAGKQLNLQATDMGRPLNHLIRNPEFVEYLQQEDLSSSVELPSVVHSNQWLLFSASHFGDEDIVLEVTDITRLKNMETLRKEFVGNVSHELRTPITVLRGYLETLGDGVVTDNPVVQKACKQMSEQVVRMQALADDLIILSRLEAEPVATKLENVSLAPLLQTIVADAKVVSNNKHVITLDCPDQVALAAQTNEIHSALSNLVINAVRHNPQGANIHIKVTTDEQSLAVSISDDGVGISSDAVPRLTERFYRTDSSRSSNVGGTGLGLAIVKHVINRYGGELEINSRLGAGAEFICRFSYSAKA